jgi:hypothetical protein
MPLVNITCLQRRRSASRSVKLGRLAGGWRVVQSGDALPAAGCYAIYHSGRLVYLGSSANLKTRLSQHLRRQRDNSEISVKVAPSRRNGDWLMREYRLIRRLRPRDNKMFAGVPPAPPPLRPQMQCLGCEAGHPSIDSLIACENANFWSARGVSVGSQRPVLEKAS